ncbi:hypothetical protein HK16_14235 [Acetobacter senegalensis]|uniref:Uncharacterized protein n=1 Tax=Acetobacter senegalensis TaxID=446692 RepID=A0A252EHC5_9PROT|nr:hypothetical protein HK16_14235 [Acetobacter senegalensis]
MVVLFVSTTERQDAHLRIGSIKEGRTGLSNGVQLAKGAAAREAVAGANPLTGLCQGSIRLFKKLPDRIILTRREMVPYDQ